MLNIMETTLCCQVDIMVFSEQFFYAKDANFLMEILDGKNAEVLLYL